MQAQSSQSGKNISENLTLKNYEKRVKEDVRLVHENLHEMLKLLKIDDDKTLKTYDDFNISKVSQADIDLFEIQIRTSNIVKSTESLCKIVSDLKDLTILNDFKSINSQITSQWSFLKSKEIEVDQRLALIKDNLIKLLIEMQTEYYTSNYK